MPRYNVEADGQWACFSSIVDAFITPFMSLENYEKWRSNEYGKDKVPLEKSNKMTLADSLYNLSLNKDAEEIVENLRDAGLMCRREEE